MGKMKFKSPANMRLGDNFTAELVEVSASELVYRGGGVELEYRGDFDVDGDLVLGGTVERVKTSSNDKVVYKLKQMEIDLEEHLRAWDEDGFIDGTLVFLSGDDRMVGSSGDDTLLAGDGDDKMKGKDGDDDLRGGSGDDKVKGQDGDDTLFGQGGSDKLVGGEGADFLYGGSGDDKLKGKEGDDVLFGDDGDDVLDGGDGADLFVFDDDDGSDVLRDFERGTDRIALDRGLDLDDVAQEAVDGGTLVTIGETEIFLRGVDGIDVEQDVFVLV